ncbi:MarR family transcriptional regulator [Microbacterium sp. 10M-3C3]|jgi:DNA-binding MarR family transcriptional regulator|uniref:MarR family winged helix-turn-helix transcriptional regulator n=1 Tax=Microbacterium sp. 10M-3C3 TaxID=2483401 RepID=UPI000F62F806|nr:MarR family transcriptional regulator [Microbacterium sp. 10M-3C3]
MAETHAADPAPRSAIDLDTATLLSLAGGLADRIVLQAMRARGHHVTRAHGFIFQRLLTGEQSITALAADLRITQQGASKHVQELERLGLVTRRTDERDKRARVVALTDRGRAAIALAREARAAFESHVAALVGVEELAATRHALAAVLDDAGITAHIADRSIPWQD